MDKVIKEGHNKIYKVVLEQMKDIGSTNDIDLVKDIKSTNDTVKGIERTNDNMIEK